MTPAASAGRPGRPHLAGRPGPAARYGRWLVLIWPPLLLGALIVEAAREGAWVTLGQLLAVGVAFVISMVAYYRSGPPLARASFVMQVVLSCLAWLIIGIADATLPYVLLPLLVIGAGVIFQERLAPAVIVAVTAAGAAVTLLGGWALSEVGSLVIVTLLSGMGSFVVHRLAATVAELARTRRELADAAVAAERVRFSRDLHDLLGHTLSVIVVKAQVVRRLAKADPAGAAAHGAEIEALGRSALAEVREAVAGYRTVALAGELNRAAEALRAGDIRAEVSTPTAAVDPEAGAVLGWVVREGVTNVLRHAGARTCRIGVGADAERAWVSVEDDGTGGGHPAGTGLSGLAERVRARGGKVTAERTAGGFRLRAEVPLTHPPRDPGSPPPATGEGKGTA